jgi:hypothetical protein
MCLYCLILLCFLIDLADIFTVVLHSIRCMLQIVCHFVKTGAVCLTVNKFCAFCFIFCVFCFYSVSLCCFVYCLCVNV